MKMNHANRLELAKKSLKGLSIGDAFGESFFGDRTTVLSKIDAREIPETTWEFTDDTVMAMAIFEQLEKYKTIIQDDLALAFANNSFAKSNLSSSQSEPPIVPP